MSEWREVTLGDLIEISHGFAFKGAYFSEGGDKRLVTPGNFFETGGFRDRGAKQKSYDGPIPEQYVLDPGEIVVAMTEQADGLLGSSGLVPSQGMWLHNQRIGRVRARGRATNKRFIYYLFNSPGVRAQISATATGAKVRHTAPERILGVKVIVPDSHTQARIAAVLGAFDELIEINERRIELLEDLARSLYRKWFERAPEGAQPQGRGAVTTTIASVAELVKTSINPAKHSETSFEYFSIPAFDAGRLPAFEYGASIKSNKTLISGACVLLSKLNPRIPRIWFATPETDRAIASTEFLVWRGTKVSNVWLWAALSDDGFRRRLAGAAAGTSTSHQRVKPSDIAGHVISDPDPDRLKAFDPLAEPGLYEAVALRQANRALARTRDLLLPRLLTGRLDISDVDLGDLFPDEAAT